MVNLIVAKFLPSFAGLGHRLFYKNDQETGMPIKALIVALGLSVALAGGASSIAAAEVGSETTVEIGGSAASVDGEAVDSEVVADDATSYYVGIIQPVGETNRFAFNVALERIAFDDGGEGSGDVGGYAIDARFGAQFGPPSCKFRIAAGAGFAFTEAFLQESGVEVVFVPAEAMHGVSPPLVPAALEAETMVEDDETSFRWSIEAGVTVKLTPQNKIGGFASYVLTDDMTGEGSLADQAQIRIGITVPIPGGA